MAHAFDVIAIAAHPDDAEAACGGLLLKLSRRGYRVAICDLTRGELASNGTVAERQQEAERAAGVLELAGRINLGLPDGGLVGDDPEQQRAVVHLLRQSKPALLIAPHEASRHPDHAAATLLARRAQFFCGVHGYDASLPAVDRPVLVRALDFHPMPQPAFVVDIQAELDAKLEALRCYASQFVRGPGRAATLLNDTAYLRRIETNARAYGQLVGCAAGEPYALDAPPRLDDPVATLGPGRGGRPA
jgi:bacillithiol biosynthesis deacetylase BshB1